MIAAHYGFSDVFDNLIISLCKFTTLSSEVSCAILLWFVYQCSDDGKLQLAVRDDIFHMNCKTGSDMNYKKTD